MQRRPRIISLGRLAISPRKRSKANVSLVTLDFHAKRKEFLRKKIAALKNVPPAPPSPSATPSMLSSSQDHRAGTSPSSMDRDGVLDSPMLAGPSTAPTTPTTPSKKTHIPSLNASPTQLMLFPEYDIAPFSSPSATKTPKARRKPKPKPRKLRKVRTAAEEAEGIIQRWKTLLPTLKAVYLQYKERMIGKSIENMTTPAHQCSGECIVVDSEVHVYHVDHHRIQTFKLCSCQTLAQTLVLHGFFPTSPSQHRMAVAIELLDLYQALCEHSLDAVTSLAAALKTAYRQCGFQLLDSAGMAPTDPLRCALGHSLEWYDMLRNNIDRHLNDCLKNTKSRLPQLPNTISSITSTHTTSNALSIASTPQLATVPHANTQSEGSNQPVTAMESEEVAAQPLAPGQCAGYLQRLCPACFGGKQFGESFQNSRDIHIALDGNFHHHHLKSGGDGVEFYDSYHFLDKEFVDAVGLRIEEACKKPPKPRNPVVPDKVVDADSESYKAAKGDKEQASSKRFDENGMMALVSEGTTPTPSQSYAPHRSARSAPSVSFNLESAQDNDNTDQLAQDNDNEDMYGLDNAVNAASDDMYSNASPSKLKRKEKNVVSRKGKGKAPAVDTNDTTPKAARNKRKDSPSKEEVSNEASAKRVKPTPSANTSEQGWGSGFTSYSNINCLRGQQASSSSSIITTADADFQPMTLPRPVVPAATSKVTAPTTMSSAQVNPQPMAQHQPPVLVVTSKGTNVAAPISPMPSLASSTNSSTRPPAARQSGTVTTSAAAPVRLCKGNTAGPTSASSSSIPKPCPVPSNNATSSNALQAPKGTASTVLPSAPASNPAAPTPQRNAAFENPLSSPLPMMSAPPQFIPNAQLAMAPVVLQPGQLPELSLEVLWRLPPQYLQALISSAFAGVPPNRSGAGGA
ncbi:hypothetical protein PM082_021729 [Marasmius tenuissimus]|nr:hypothetical protein PM082_021729 [Marasmius tenuissimus]